MAARVNAWSTDAQASHAASSGVHPAPAEAGDEDDDVVRTAVFRAATVFRDSDRPGGDGDGPAGVLELAASAPGESPTSGGEELIVPRRKEPAAQRPQAVTPRAAELARGATKRALPTPPPKGSPAAGTTASLAGVVYASQRKSDLTQRVVDARQRKATLPLRAETPKALAAGSPSPATWTPAPAAPATPATPNTPATPTAPASSTPVAKPAVTKPRTTLKAVAVATAAVTGKQDGAGAAGAAGAAASSSSYKLRPGYLATGPLHTVSFSKGSSPLGLSIVGGKDTYLGAVFVTKVKDGSAAARNGRITAGAKVLEVNGLDLRRMRHDQVVKTFKAAQDPLTFKIMKIPADEFAAIMNAATEATNDAAAATSAGAAQPVPHDAMEPPLVTSDTASAAPQVSTSPKVAPLLPADSHAEGAVSALTVVTAVSVPALTGDALPPPRSSSDQLSPTAGAVLSISVPHKSTAEDWLGVTLVGGVHTAYGGVFIAAIAPDSVGGACGLQVGDRVLALDIHGVIAATLAAAEALVASHAGPAMSMLVVRAPEEAWYAVKREVNMWRDSSADTTGLLRAVFLRRVQDNVATATTVPLTLVTLDRASGSSGKLGIKFAGGKETELGGVFVTGLTPDGAAAAEGTLQPGARILECNGHTMVFRTQLEGKAEMANSAGLVRLLVQQLPDEAWLQLTAQLTGAIAPKLTAAAAAATTAATATAVTAVGTTNSPATVVSAATQATDDAAVGQALNEEFSRRRTATLAQVDCLGTCGTLHTVALPKDASIAGALVGSADDGYGALFVTENQPFGLYVGDRLLALDGQSLLSISRDAFFERLQKGASQPTLLVLRPHSAQRWVDVATEARALATAEGQHMVRGFKFPADAPDLVARVQLVSVDVAQKVALVPGPVDDQIASIVVHAVGAAANAPPSLDSSSLQPGDRVLEIGGHTTFGASVADAAALLAAVGEQDRVVYLAVQRPSPAEMVAMADYLEQYSDPRTVRVSRQNGSLGFGIIGPSNVAAVNAYQARGVFVQKISQDAKVEPALVLRVGDQIVEIEGQDTLSWTFDTMRDRLMAVDDSVTLTVVANPAGLQAHLQELAAVGPAAAEEAPGVFRERRTSVARSETLRQKPAYLGPAPPGDAPSADAKLGAGASASLLAIPTLPVVDDKAGGLLRPASPASPASADAVPAQLAAQVTASLPAPTPTPAASPTIRTLIISRDAAGSFNFAALGADADGADASVFVSRVTPDSATAHAGLVVGDEILTINGESCVGVSSATLVKWLKPVNLITLTVRTHLSEFVRAKTLHSSQKHPSPVDAPASAHAADTMLGPAYADLPYVRRASIGLESWSEIDYKYQPTEFSLVEHGSDADPTDAVAQKLKYNAMDGSVDRRSLEGYYSLSGGLPRFPGGRTGVTGRGVLARWGPNHAVAVLVTRERTPGVLEFIAVQESPNARWRLPGKFMPPGPINLEDMAATAKVCFGEQVLGVHQHMSPDMRKLSKGALTLIFDETVADDVQLGIMRCDDRNTDNAWVEIVASSYHVVAGAFDGVPLAGNAKTGGKAEWVSLDCPGLSVEALYMALCSAAMHETDIPTSISVPQTRLQYTLSRSTPSETFGFQLKSSTGHGDIAVAPTKLVKKTSVSKTSVTLKRTTMKREQAALSSKACHVIFGVKPGSLAAKAGLLNNDMLVVLDGTEVASVLKDKVIGMMAQKPKLMVTVLRTGSPVPVPASIVKALPLPAPATAAGSQAAKLPLKSLRKETLALTVERGNVNQSFGFGLATFENGSHVVSKLSGSSPHVLRVGDELLAINSTSVKGLSHAEVLDLCVLAELSLAVVVLRSSERAAVRDMSGWEQRNHKFQQSVGKGGAEGKALVQVKLTRAGPGLSFGFSLASADNGRHFVAAISPGGVADGILAVGDELKTVAGTAIAGIGHDKVLDLCSGANLDLNVTILRGKSETKGAADAAAWAERKHKFQQSVGKGAAAMKQILRLRVTRAQVGTSFGFSLSSFEDGRHTVSKLSPGGVAENRLQLGDELIAVMNTNTKDLTHAQVLSLCCAVEHDLDLTVLRNVDNSTLSAGPSAPPLRQQQSVGRLAPASLATGLRRASSWSLIEVELTKAKLTDSFGFSVETLPFNGAHIVKGVKPEVCGTKILVSDEFQAINGIDLKGLAHEKVIDIIKNNLTLKIALKRNAAGKSDNEAAADLPPLPPSSTFHVVLKRASLQESFGIAIATLDSGDHAITKVVEAVVGDKIKPLDVVLKINDVAVSKLSHADVVQLLKADLEVNLELMRNVLIQGNAKVLYARTPSLKHTKVTVHSEGNAYQQTFRGSVSHAIAEEETDSNGVVSVPAAAAGTGTGAGTAALPAAPAVSSAPVAPRESVSSTASALPVGSVKVVVLRRGDNGFGFVLVGPPAPGSSYISVAGIKCAPALGSGLEVGDQIVRVRGGEGGEQPWVDLSKATQSEAAAALKPHQIVTLVVRREPVAPANLPRASAVSANTVASTMTPLARSTSRKSNKSVKFTSDDSASGATTATAAAGPKPARRAGGGGGGLFSCCRSQDGDAAAREAALQGELVRHTPVRAP